jgi:hypothetical protein
MILITPAALKSEQPNMELPRLIDSVKESGEPSNLHVHNLTMLMLINKFERNDPLTAPCDGPSEPVNAICSSKVSTLL